VPGAYAFVDECLGQMLQRLPEETALLIVSDHGFRGALTTDFLHVDLNGLLHRLGDFERGDDGGADWGRTRAFNLEDTGSAVRGIHLNIEGREQQGRVALKEAAALKESLGRSLTSLVSSEGDPLFLTVRVVEDPTPGSPDIELTENRAIGPLGTILVGGGPPVLVRDLFRRYDDWSADLYDVAPTVLYLLGLPLGAAMRGRPITAILERAPAGDYPVTDSYERLLSAPAPAPRSDAATEKELRDLRDRGHLR
jgi:predicted AlkP superfamily phosphohydrolase/phosphomutase